MSFESFESPIFGYIPFTTFMVMVTFVVYSLFVKRITVFSVVLFVKFSLEMLHQAFKLFLMGHFGHPVYYDLVNFSWYFSFAITDILAVILLYKLVDLLKLKRNWLLKYFSIIYITLAFVQVAGYVDRFVIGSDIFTEMYSYLIKSANVIGACLLTWYFAAELMKYFRERGSDNTLY